MFNETFVHGKIDELTGKNEEACHSNLPRIFSNGCAYNSLRPHCDLIATGKTAQETNTHTTYNEVQTEQQFKQLIN